MQTFTTILLVAVALAGVSANTLAMPGWPAMPSFPMGPAMGGPPMDFLENVVLKAEADKILATVGLDEDLSQQTDAVLQNAQLNFANCKAISFIGMQYRCFFTQFKASQNELKAIDDEIKRRDAAAITEAATATA